MRVRLSDLLAMVLLMTAASETARGQGFQGGLRGAAHDAGGVVPGVEITLTNEATNAKRSTVTNERGEYVFASLDPGTYALKATLQGFKTIERPGLKVGTQQFLVIDLALEVGALEEHVTVKGESPLTETANASHGTVLDSTALQTLPAPGRNAFMIGVTVPTVIPTGDTQFNRQQDQTNASLLSLGGGTRRGNNYTLDGVPITDMRNRASANPTIEALEDLRVQVHTYDAEMARTGGGTFNTTAKSGTNALRGSAFYQTRPIWGEKNNYFSELARQDALQKGDTATAARLAKPNNPYYLGGGSVGGPIVKNRTFFFFASEDYHDVQTRNASVLMPTEAERRGDFSAVTNSSGTPVTIYDPLTRTPFGGNVIPSGRINPVAAAMLKFLPLPDTDVDRGSSNYNRTSLINNRFEQQYTLKVEHKFTDRVSLSGFYLYNRTDEPCANYFGTASQDDPNRFADPLDYILKRRPQVLALNNTWVLSDTSVMALRFGMTRFPDDQTLSVDFDPATLGFSPTFLNQITVRKFPDVRIRGYDSFASQTFGAIDPYTLNWKSTSANGTYSKFVGSHTFKMGADFRRVGADNYNPGNGAGFFDFDKDITSSNGGNSSTTDGNAFASFLLGFPSALSNRQSSITLSTPLNVYAYYYGGYWQDDWRVSSKLTLNYGLRVEHEDGLREVHNNFSVGFDPAATSALSSITIPADPVAGTPARQVAGGLMYAGVNGNRTTQGNPPGAKWSPRGGAVYSINTKTVLRGGYGMYWAPWNYPIPDSSSNNYGQVGYSQNTIVPQTSGVPTVSLTNPFPNGIVQPLGNSLGTLTGVGTNISYVDQNGTAPRVHQFSADLQRELPGSMAIKVSYVGSRGRHLTLGGSNDFGLNVNQLDPKYMSLGSALATQLPNPFFGNPGAGPFAAQATLSRAQLLRPFPQFGNVLARRVTEGKNQYDAGILEWTKRVTHGIGGRVSYTYSVLKDNQIGEGNFYGPQTASGTGTLNQYYYVKGSPYYNPDADFTYSVNDVPHRVIIAPIVQPPFGRGRKWGTGRMADWIIGGWTVSAAINLQSGFPLFVVQSDNTGTFGGTQRPNLTGAPFATPGSYADRLASADHPTATWISRDAFTAASANTFGDAPRTLPDARTPGQYNADAVFIKEFRFKGKSAQLKIEELNLFNRVNVRALRGSGVFGNSNFGQTNIQAGFMRITQIMFRFSF
ncbi:MAG TPA: carboxypeptidase-like regulatory domain-containing protein [Vicinamibacterales bacterium]|nr:carboxypeptidase-like regulatory domain-containing protein [Vicinamibacterales bacterium]